jgi:hypothetical protein
MVARLVVQKVAVMAEHLVDSLVGCLAPYSAAPMVESLAVLTAALSEY